MIRFSADSDFRFHDFMIFETKFHDHVPQSHIISGTCPSMQTPLINASHDDVVPVSVSAHGSLNLPRSAAIDHTADHELDPWRWYIVATFSLFAIMQGVIWGIPGALQVCFQCTFVLIYQFPTRGSNFAEHNDEDSQHQ
jgi:hypothetical protein